MTLTRDRRHADPVIFADRLREGDTFLDQTSGHTVTVLHGPATTIDGEVRVVVTGGRSVDLDPCQLVNLEGRR